MDRKAELIRQMQEEMDRRTKIENEAIQLMREDKFEQATALLSSIDDSIIKGINEKIDKLDTAVEDNDADNMISAIDERDIAENGVRRMSVTHIRSHKKKDTHITVLVDGSLEDFEK